MNKKLLHVMRVHPAPRGIRAGIAPPAIFDVDDVFTVDLESPKISIKVRLSEVDGDSLVGVVVEGSTEAVELGNCVSLTYLIIKNDFPGD